MRILAYTTTKIDKERLYDIIAGSLIGGAAGDALGYEVEFNSLASIERRYGQEGIRHYVLHGDKALISDDTQMTLFTAYALTRLNGRPYDHAEALAEIGKAYLAWYRTQGGSAESCPHCPLEDIKALRCRRAPGVTCLTALETMSKGGIPYNDSKGCGGAMRVAPIALYALGREDMDENDVALLAGDAARLTHRHPLGFISAAYLATLMYISHDDDYSHNSFPEKVLLLNNDASNILKACYGPTYESHINIMFGLVSHAFQHFVDDNSKPIDNIRSLGEGWVGEEAVAIAYYCALKNSTDFSEAIRMAVNHDGDSDSTGAVCGNILGAHIGYKNLPDCWKDKLELHDTILDIARQLAQMKD